MSSQQISFKRVNHDISLSFEGSRVTDNEEQLKIVIKTDKVSVEDAFAKCGGFGCF